MSNGRANERIEGPDPRRENNEEASPHLGAEVYQRKAGSIRRVQRHADYQAGESEVLAPGMVVDARDMAAPIAGAGSLADQAGLHGVDAGHATSISPDIAAYPADQSAYNAPSGYQVDSTYDAQGYQQSVPQYDGQAAMPRSDGQTSVPSVPQYDGQTAVPSVPQYDGQTSVPSDGQVSQVPDYRAPITNQTVPQYRPSTGTSTTDTQYQPATPAKTTPGSSTTATDSTSQSTQGGYGQVAPGFKYRPTDAVASGDPNANGSNGKRPWRAGYGQVAPAFKPDSGTQAQTGVPSDQVPGTTSSTPTNRTGYGEVAPGASGNGSTIGPNGEVVPKFGQKPPGGTVSTGTPGAGGDKTLGQMVKQKQDLVDASLDKSGSGFWGNEIIGGVSAMAAGGPLARLADYGTKRVVAMGDADPNKPLRLLDRISVGYQRRFGLVDNESVLNSLFKKDREAGDAVGERVKFLQDERDRITAEAKSNRLASVTPEEQQALGRYRYLTGQEPENAYEFKPLDEDVQMRQRLTTLDDQIKSIEDEKSHFKGEELVKLTDADADLVKQLQPIADAAEKLGQPALDKFERAGEAALSSEELPVMRKYQFLKSLEFDPKADPATFGVTLTPVEQDLISTRDGLSRFVSNIEETSQDAIRRYQEAGAKALSPEELSNMRRFQFYKDFMSDPTRTPKQYGATLIGDEPGLVTRHQQVAGQLKAFEPYQERVKALPGLIEEHGKLQQQWDDMVKGLEEKATVADAKLRKPLTDVMTDADKSFIAKYDYLKGGAEGPVPEGVKLDASEAEIVARKHAFSDRIGLLDPWGSGQRMQMLAERDVLSKQMAGMADDLKPGVDSIIEKLAARTATDPKKGIPSAEKVLSADELKVWNKYEFFRSGGQTKAPGAGVLSAEEADIAARVADLDKRLGAFGEADARAASTWRAKFDINGKKIAEGHLGNFVRGMGVVAAGDFVADRLDNLNVWGSSHRGAAPYAEALAPWVGLAVPGGWMKKGAAVIGLEVAGSFLDHAYPVDAGSKWNSLLRPDGLDAIALGVASSIPMRNETIGGRLALMGIGLGVEKTAKLFFQGTSGKEVRDKALEAVKKDQSDRSAGSMNSAIDKLKKLDDYPIQGKVVQPMSVLEYYLADQLSTKGGDKVSNDRGSIAYMAAAGEARLAKGTLVSAGTGGAGESKLGQLWNAVSSAITHKDDVQFNYIFNGTDLDLGGQAATYLVGAKSEIAEARKDTPQDKKDQLSDLDKVAKRINEDLGKIYGKHDIPKLFKELEEHTYKLNQQSIGKLRDRINAKLASPGTDDKQYIAKLNRDMAMIDMAFAAIKVGYNGVGNGNDGASAAIMMQEALARLQTAKSLDAKNEDQAQLEQLAQELGKKVPVAVQKQGQSTVNNPFGVKNFQ